MKFGHARQKKNEKSRQGCQSIAISGASGAVTGHEQGRQRDLASPPVAVIRGEKCHVRVTKHYTFGPLPCSFLVAAGAAIDGQTTPSVI